MNDDAREKRRDLRILLDDPNGVYYTNADLDRWIAEFGVLRAYRHLKNRERRAHRDAQAS